MHFILALRFIDGGLRTRDEGMYLMLTLSWRFVMQKLRFIDLLILRNDTTSAYCRLECLGFRLWA